MKRWKAVFCVLLACAPAVGSSCSFKQRAYGGFDPKELVFYGQVVGYTKLELPSRFPPPTENERSWGLKVVVLNSVSMPEPNPREVELYFFGLDAECSRIPVDQAVIERTPIGTRLQVVARQFNLGERVAEATTPQLDGSDWSSAIVIRLPADADIGKLNDVRQDYSRSRPFDLDKVRDFQLRKDMARLEASHRPDEKREILLRLAEYPWTLGDERGNEAATEIFRRVLQRYVADEKVARELDQRHSDALYDLGLVKDEDGGSYALRRAQQGDPRFEYEVGRMLARTDPIHAAYWLRKSGNAGFANATFELALLYARSDWGNNDPRMAKKYQGMVEATLRRAARQARDLAMRDDPRGMMLYSQMGSSSHGGLHMPPEEARWWRCKALKVAPRSDLISWMAPPEECAKERPNKN